MLLQPCSGICERLITGVPSTSSSAALIVAYWRMSGTSLISTHSRAIRSRSCEDLLVRLERQGEEDLIDALRREHLLGLARGAEHGHAADHRSRLAGIVVEEADDLEAHLAVGEDLGGDLAPQQAGADDQDALQVVAGAAHPPQHRARHHARGGDQHEVDQREEAEEGAAVGEVLVAARRRGRPVPGDHHRQAARWRAARRGRW